jgi:hypothetical protein
MWTAQWQAVFLVLNDLVGCGHMSGLTMRRIRPRALMKSDDLDPYHWNELYTHARHQGVPGFRSRPCRSSLFDALTNLELVPYGDRFSNSNLDCSCFRVKLLPKTLAGFHHRPDDPGKFVRYSHRNKARGLLRAKRYDPFGERAFAFAGAT